MIRGAELETHKNDSNFPRTLFPALLPNGKRSVPTFQTTDPRSQGVNDLEKPGPAPNHPPNLGVGRTLRPSTTHFGQVALGRKEVAG